LLLCLWWAERAVDKPFNRKASRRIDRLGERLERRL
jgi:hypothetical protein